jgi:hypothetical protein
MSEVKLFRMNSGEEIIAKAVEPASHKLGSWLIKSPAILIPVGDGKLGIAPWMPYCDTDNMELPEKAIAFVATPKKELINNYNSSFGSGLVVPEKAVESPNLRLITE